MHILKKFAIEVGIKKQVYPQAGFTLVELMVVIAIFGMLAGLGLAVSFQTFRVYNFQDEATRLVSAFQSARSRSMANIDQVEHGVCFDNTNPSHSAYIIKSGNPCNGSAGQEVNISKTVTLPSFSIIFDQLSGRTTGTNILLTYPDKTITIEINNEGRINWKNG